MNNTVPNTSRRNSKYIYRLICSAVLTLLATAFFVCAWYEFVSHNNITGYLLGYGNLGMATGIYLILFVLIGRWLGAFDIGIVRMSNNLASLVLALFTLDFIEMFISCAITGQFRFFFRFMEIYFACFLIQAIVLCCVLLPMVRLYRKIFRPIEILEIIGDYDNNLAQKMGGIPYKYHIAESISCHQDENVIHDVIKKYDAVLLNDLPAALRNKYVKMCYEMNKRTYYVPKISDIIVKTSEELNLIDAPLFLNKNNGIGPVMRYLKRAFDVILSLLALVIFSPVFAVTAVAINMEDKGPVFFRQDRVTLGGEKFKILKFRSMKVDADKDTKPHSAEQDDDRITKTGKIIRRFRIDELPQLINILKGDMSIVGPRPEMVENVREYCQEVPEFVYRTKVKAGLTGYAQVYGKYNTTALDKLKLDLLYITNISLLLDLQIIFETVKILVQKDSTEGFVNQENDESK